MTLTILPALILPMIIGTIGAAMGAPFWAVMVISCIVGFIMYMIFTSFDDKPANKTYIKESTWQEYEEAERAAREDPRQEATP